MKAFNDAMMYARFGFGLHRFLRQKLTLDEARAWLINSLARREDNFLQVLRKGVYGYSASPYLPLLEWAGCEFGDVEQLVRKEGLTAALKSLRESGVYVTFEEFKGRETIRRGSREFPLGTRSFDNPWLKRCYVGETGGSTGAGTRVAQDLDALAAKLPMQMMSKHVNRVANIPHAIWRAPLPSAIGINAMITGGVTGNVPRKWFAPLLGDDLRQPLKYRLATSYILGMVRLHGVPAPSPEKVPLDRADVIVRWIEQTLKEEGAAQVASGVSLSLRIADAAKEMGVDLTGAVLSGGGEPPTPTKVEAITASGARFFSSYHFTEGGAVGLPCANPVDCNDHHFMAHHLEVLQYPRLAPGTDVEVQAFNFTSLLPSAAKILLNVEIDDYGTIEERSCGCEWEQLGFTRHVRNIRSFRKLTGEGMTLIGSDMERILDHTLPARFGGTAQDYQLWEEELPSGFTQRSIVVSPRVKLENEQDVVTAVLEALGQGDAAADLARAFMDHGKSLVVKRADPVWTNRGKLMPLHQLQPDDPGRRPA